MKIPFNKPYLTGKETDYIVEAVSSGHISGNGVFTKRCQLFFENKYGYKKTLMTTSCTDALEMCAILLNISPGDEVIIPSYTFVSTALAFIRQGANIIFADSQKSNPNIDPDNLEKLITKRTKAIVVVHYAGVACDMDVIMAIAKRNNLYVVEDAAQAIDSFYKQKPLGGIGHLATFSFHETKNIQCGEGGLLIINDDKFIKRAEIIWEKGTNRAEFFRGEINKYGWVDTGSSFLPSELNSAFLFAQLENLEKIQKKRILIRSLYYKGLKELHENGYLKIQNIPAYATDNGHMFYVLCNSEEERNGLISYLKEREILTVFHYQSLHKSNYYQSRHDGRSLNQSDYYTDHLLRLPLYYNLENNEVDEITETINRYYTS